MKKLLLLAAILLNAGIAAFAQIPFNTMDSVDVNNITANVLVHGDMWWNPVDYSVPGCQLPAHSGLFFNFTSALWMAGYDGGNNLHVAAQMYRQNGNDFWPGPLDSSDTLTYPTSYAWAKIWKVNIGDIYYFQSLSAHTIANTPQAILTWPGKGNVNAEGNAGSALTVTNDMAPFVDLNGDGIYEPLQGEYPDIKGDQTLWWVFSDNGPAHTSSNGRPLGVEVHAMAYAYQRGTLIDNVVYYDYTIVNKSANTYTDFRLGQFDDVELGWYLDDYIGFDSTWRMGICYNGTNDDGVGGGFPVNSYGTHIPQMGLTMIVLPGDVGTNYVPAGSFDYFNNDASIIGNPTVDTQFNNYLRGKLPNGQHFTDDFVGVGIPSIGYGSGPDCNYVFTGDPSDPTKWSECTCNNNPEDRRFVLASNDFILTAGGNAHIVMALLGTNPDVNNGCPTATFDSIRIFADTAWNIYYNPLPPKPEAATAIANKGSITIYPNPAHDVLYIENTGNNYAEESITVYNTIGQAMDIAIDKNGTKDVIDVARLPDGFYYVVYSCGGVQKTEGFVKN